MSREMAAEMPMVEWPFVSATLCKRAYLFAVVQALIVIFQSEETFLLSLNTFRSVHDVASEEFLPEGEAARGACVGKD